MITFDIKITFMIQINNNYDSIYQQNNLFKKNPFNLIHFKPFNANYTSYKDNVYLEYMKFLYAIIVQKQFTKNEYHIYNFFNKIH